MVLGGALGPVFLVARIGLVGRVDDVLRQVIQLLARPHCVELNLRHPFGVVQPVIGFRDGANGQHTVVGHEHDCLAGIGFQQADHAVAFGFVGGRPLIVGVVTDAAHQPEFGLADRLDLLVFEPGQRGGEGHVGVEHRLGLGDVLVDRGVDAEGGIFDDALAGQDVTLPAHFHEATCVHLGPMGAERDLIIAVSRAGHAGSQVVEDAFRKPLAETQPVGRGQVHPFVPLLFLDRLGLYADDMVHRFAPAAHSMAGYA